MNLLSKLHKNSILTGPVESYCLACDCVLRSEEECYYHIQDSSHAFMLSTLPRLADYNDCIIKIKDGYFCCYCNLILPTIKRVGLHVLEPKHSDNKNAQSITRQAGVILAFDTVIINDRSWNGLDGSTCSICNEDYDDERIHKSGKAHVLNLIQAKCEFGETFVYRKVDDELFFCLICDEILSISEKPAHHDSEKHRDNYECSKQEGSAVQNLPSIEANNNSYDHINSSKAENNKTKTEENKAQNVSVVDDSKTTIQKKNQESPVLNTESQINKTCKSESQIKETIENTQEVKLASQNKSTQEEKKASFNSVAKNIEPKNAVAVKPKVETNKPVAVDDEINGTATEPLDDCKLYVSEYIKARNFIIKAQDNTYCTLCDVSIDKANINTHSCEKHHCILYEKIISRLTSSLSKTETVKEKENKTVSKPPKTNSQVSAKGKTNTLSEKEKVAPVDVKANQKDVSKRDEAAEKVVDSKKSEESTVKQTQEAVTVSSENPAKKESTQATVKTKSSVIDEAKPHGTAKASEVKDKPTECELADKENKTPSKKNNDTHSIPLREDTNERNKGEIKQETTEIIVQHKKGTKKAQKKAAKAKASETKQLILPKEVDKVAALLPEVCGLGTGETSTEKHNCVTQVPTTLLNDSNNLEAAATKDTHEKVETQVKSEIMAAKFVNPADLTTEEFMKLVKTVSQVDSAPDDVVVNSKYVLGNLSFVLVVLSDDASEAECVACSERLSLDDINKHFDKDEHRINVEDCLVVTSLTDEFIRKMKTEKYHCGYCNMVLQDWDDMKRHLESYRHSDAKTSAAWRLERYRPHLRHCDTKEVRSILNTIFRFIRV